MALFKYLVIVDTDTEEHANRIITERIEKTERIFEEGTEIEYLMWLCSCDGPFS